MPDQTARIVKVLVASPSDVDKERKIVEEVINEWNIRNKAERQLGLEAVLWESSTAPDSGDRTQGIINRQIVDTCDFAIGIFWTRIGTDTGVAPGGAVEEVERMMNMGKKVMLYFSVAPISREKVDKEQETKLEVFKETIRSNTLVEKYEDCNRFRDKLVHHLDLQVRQWFLPTVNMLQHYQETLKEELGYIRMLGLPGVENVQVNLNDDTFVPLRLTDSYERGNILTGKSVQQSEEVERVLYPDEIMKRAFKKRRMLLVIGDPGAGKTTLLKYYTLCALDKDHSDRLGFSGPVNVFYFPLRELLRDANGQYKSLPANLALWSERHHQVVEAQHFNEWLQSGTALVLLDGLDEISNTEERKVVCRWIDNAWSGFSKAFFVVTSRATGYRKDEGIELRADCERADVQDFTSEQQERFLMNWFRAAFLREPCGNDVEEAEWQRRQRAKADERTTKMVAHLHEEKSMALRQLAAVPMILQIMAILWKERDYMPKSRVMLYNAVLDYLLEIRDERRGIRQQMSAAHARMVLAPLSLWMQETLKRDEAAKHDVQKKMTEQLTQLDTPPSASDFCDYLINRAGLLVETVPSDYMFRHKSFREYLAGVELVKKTLRTSGYLDVLISGFGDDWWEEPIRFFIAQTDADLFDLFMEKLFDSPKSDALTQKQKLLLLTLIEEAPLKKVDALCKKLLDPATSAARQRVILDCLKAINKPAALDALQEFREKKLSGKNLDVISRTEDVILALGGEPLPLKAEKSITGKPLSYRNPNEQNAEYILIPGGRYIYSETEKEVNVEDLYVARYPVTNKLYRAFIASLSGKDAIGGVFVAELNTVANKNVWGAEFGDYLKSGKGNLAALFRSKCDEERKFDGEDQPVVGVTWYAARAYCLWLSLQEGGKEELFRLPTEIEWEWAAGGKHGESAEKVRRYPWSDESREPDSRLANYGNNVGATTPVGSYPDGATPEGLYDMAGNVWEWTESWWNEETRSLRVLRGGSWNFIAQFCRSASRSYFPPDYRSHFIGFRLVFVPQSVGSSS
jgi:formylglycine-generating enzyme required for sulfatase activity